MSAAANVRLLDSSNYSNYKNGRRHRYYGGYVKKSPYRIIVPNSGHWYITIDLGGYSGTVKHSWAKEVSNELRDNMDYKVIVSQDAFAASYRKKVPTNTWHKQMNTDVWYKHSLMLI